MNQIDCVQQPLSFGIITDSHIDPNIPERSTSLNQILKHFNESDVLQLDFILHLGDTVECGLPHEYEALNKVIPAHYKKHVYAIPGNHEVRWDEWAGEKFSTHFNAPQYAFDRAGIHFIALDLTRILQEPGYVTKATLDWLHNDLQQLRHDSPIIIYLHHPIGEHHYFVSNEDELFTLIEQYNVRAIFSGHVHKQNKWVQNGVTCFSLPAVKKGPFFFWVEKEINQQGQMSLAIYSGEIKEDGTTAKSLYEKISLFGPRPGMLEKPKTVNFSVNEHEQHAHLSIELQSDHKATQIYFQLISGRHWAQQGAGDWQPINQVESNDRTTWQTTIDLTKTVPGLYKLQVRIINNRQQFWDHFQNVTIHGPPTLPDLTEMIHLDGCIEEGLCLAYDTAYRRLIIAATTDGHIVAIDCTGQLQWTFDAQSSIYCTPLYHFKYQHIIFGTKSHHIYALNATSGTVVWSYETEGIMFGEAVFDDEDVIISAGRQIVSLNVLNGTLNWTKHMNGLTAGKAVVDEDTIYVGVGDGYMHAIEKQMGTSRWQQPLDLRDRPFRTLIYSGWAGKVLLVPEVEGQPPIVIISTVKTAFGLNRYNGEIIWTGDVSGSYSQPVMYTETEQPLAIVCDDLGYVSALDPYTGEVHWKTGLSQRIFKVSPIVYNQTVYLIGVNGLLSGLNVLTGDIILEYRISRDCVYSTPIRWKNELVFANQRGTIRKLQLK